MTDTPEMSVGVYADYSEKTVEEAKRLVLESGARDKYLVFIRFKDFDLRIYPDKVIEWVRRSDD